MQKYRILLFCSIQFPKFQNLARKIDVVDSFLTNMQTANDQNLLQVLSENIFKILQSQYFKNCYNNSI